MLVQPAMLLQLRFSMNCRKGLVSCRACSEHHVSHSDPTLDAGVACLNTDKG